MPRPTFPAYADRSGFNALLPSRAPRPRAEGDLAVDHAVVGAGFTGLAAACRLAQLEPQSRIVVVEATEIGEGASARNSGFAGPRDLPAGPTAADRARATALDRFAGEGWAWLMDQVETHGIDCALRLSGRIRAAATARGAARVEALRDAVAAADMAHEMLDRAALEERIGTAYYRCALFTPDGFVLDPAALVRGLADALPANVVLCENTPLLSLAHRERWQLETPAARIAARNVVLATNAAIRKLGHLRDRLVTIYTYAALTAPLAPADAARLGTMPVWGLAPVLPGAAIGHVRRGRWDLGEDQIGGDVPGAGDGPRRLDELRGIGKSAEPPDGRNLRREHGAACREPGASPQPQGGNRGILGLFQARALGAVLERVDLDEQTEAADAGQFGGRQTGGDQVAASEPLRHLTEIEFQRACHARSLLATDVPSLICAALQPDHVGNAGAARQHRGWRRPGQRPVRFARACRDRVDGGDPDR